MEINDLSTIAEMVAERTMICTKEVLTSAEVAKFLGFSQSYIYKLTYLKAIPHYKPMGKMCFFNRKEVEAWAQSNKVCTIDEISNKAEAYLDSKGGVPC